MNDLIGLEYEWGARFSDSASKTDCFQLVCEIRKRLGLSDYADKFAWAYESYTPETFKPIRLAKWLLETGKRLPLPRHGSVALLADPTSPALGTMWKEASSSFLPVNEWSGNDRPRACLLLLD